MEYRIRWMSSDNNDFRGHTDWQELPEGEAREDVEAYMYARSDLTGGLEIAIEASGFEWSLEFREVPTLTTAQQHALEEVREDRVRHERYAGRFYSTLSPRTIRTDTVRRLVDAGLAEVGQACKHPASSHHVVLSDLGRTALATHGERE